MLNTLSISSEVQIPSIVLAHTILSVREDFRHIYKLEITILRDTEVQSFEYKSSRFEYNRLQKWVGENYGFEWTIAHVCGTVQIDKLLKFKVMAENGTHKTKALKVETVQTLSIGNPFSK